MFCPHVAENPAIAMPPRRIRICRHFDFKIKYILTQPSLRKVFANLQTFQKRSRRREDLGPAAVLAGLKARNMTAWAEASTASAGPGCLLQKIFRGR
jgi:hypothetical protein